jgi:hypothetical protein
LIFEIWDLADAHVAQSVERVLGKDEVISSILIMGSSLRCRGPSDESRGPGRAAIVNFEI